MLIDLGLCPVQNKKNHIFFKSAVYYWPSPWLRDAKIRSVWFKRKNQYFLKTVLNIINKGIIGCESNLNVYSIHFAIPKSDK